MRWRAEQRAVACDERGSAISSCRRADLPFVLQSAEVMKKSVSYLENFLEKLAGTTKAPSCSLPSTAMCTISVRTWSARSYPTTAIPCTDLGKQTPANVIIDAAVQHHRRRVGLSALLVSNVEADATDRQRAGAARPGISRVDRGARRSIARSGGASSSAMIRTNPMRRGCSTAKTPRRP